MDDVAGGRARGIAERTHQDDLSRLPGCDDPRGRLLRPVRQIDFLLFLQTRRPRAAPRPGPCRRSSAARRRCADHRGPRCWPGSGSAAGRRSVRTRRFAEMPMSAGEGADAGARENRRVLDEDEELLRLVHGQRLVALRIGFLDVAGRERVERRRGCRRSSGAPAPGPARSTETVRSRSAPPACPRASGCRRTRALRTRRHSGRSARRRRARARRGSPRRASSSACGRRSRIAPCRRRPTAARSTPASADRRPRCSSPGCAG